MLETPLYKQPTTSNTPDFRSNKINKKQSQFHKSYSQLLNQHFSQSVKEKGQLRKKTPTNKNHRPKAHSQSHQQIKVNNPIYKAEKTTNLFRSQLSLTKTPQIKPSSLDPLTKTTSSTTFKIKLNPQTNQKISQIILSKTQTISNSSYQNVLLNKKLYETTAEKKDLANLIEYLKLQILKEKKNKSKISTKMAKTMNKIEQTNKIKNKVQTERNLINQETFSITKELTFSREKNYFLSSISNANQQRIATEKQLIADFEKQNQQTKNCLMQTKTHLNELKSIFMQQSKCLTNTKLNFDQILAERENIMNVVQHSVLTVNNKDKQ